MQKRNELRHDRKVFRWLIALPALLIAGLVLFLVGFNAMYGRPNYFVGMYDAAPRLERVSFRNESWEPRGAEVRLQDDQMVAIGHNEEGYFMYVRKAELEGGGGGKPEVGAEAPDYGQLYLRRAEGAYQPLARSGGR